MAPTIVLFDVSNITRDGAPASFPSIGLGCSHDTPCPRRCGVVARLGAVELAARRAFGEDAQFRYVADNSLRGLLDDLGPLRRHYQAGVLTWTGEADDLLLADAVALGAKVVTKDGFHSKRNLDAHPWIQGDSQTFYGWKVSADALQGLQVKLVRRAMNRIDTQRWERAARKDEMKATGLSRRPELARRARETTFRCVTLNCVNARQDRLSSLPVPVAGRGGEILVCPLCRRRVEEVPPSQAGPEPAGQATPAEPGTGTAQARPEPAGGWRGAAREELDVAMEGRARSTRTAPPARATQPAPAAPSAPAPATPPGRGVLVVEFGGNRREVPLVEGTTVVLGRLADEDLGQELHIDVSRGLGAGEDYISTRHVEITPAGAGLATVVDRSKNGTSLGGELLVPHQPTRWRLDQPLTLAGALVVVTCPADSASGGAGGGPRRGEVGLRVRHPDGSEVAVPGLRPGDQMVLGRQPLPVARVSDEPRMVDVCRALTADVAEQISRRHLLLRCAVDGTVTVTDLSANGSWLGERPLDREVPVRWEGTEPVWLVQDTVAVLREPDTGPGPVPRPGFGTATSRKPGGWDVDEQY